MRSTYQIEAIRFPGNDLPIQVLDRLIVRAEGLEEVKQQTILLFETARAPRWTRPNAHALRVLDQSGTERFRCSV